jgi:hypothetical protein
MENKRTCEDITETDVNVILQRESVDWIRLAQGGYYWRTLVDTVMNICSIKDEKFLS